GNGTLSPIHLHNAPAGQNGPVVADVASDAGEGLVIVDETDILENIENVSGSGGDDQISGDEGNNVLTGGLGEDTLDGGEGNDTASFDDLNVGIVADLEAGVVTRNGFAADVAPQVLVNPNQGITNELAPADIVSEAVAGNIYFNVHTTEFPSGEVRGQLELVSDAPDGNGGRIVTLTAALDGAQEVPAPTDTPATGTATVVFTINAAGEVSYETDLDVSNLQGELLPVNIGNGTLSPIHLHNAPAGQNGPVVADVATDAGEGLVIVDETDTVENIENVIGSGGDDQISGDEGDNILTGGAGNDLLSGGDGNDVFVFADGSDNDTITDFGNGDQDRLDVSAFGPEFDLESTIDGAVQDGEDTVVTLSENDTVRLAGFDVDQLDEDDFIVFGEDGDGDTDTDLGDGDGDDLINVSGLGPDFDPESSFNGAGQDGDIASITLSDNDSVRLAGFDGDQQNQDDLVG
ncbi:MAG: CHRD domain-containing protein, partial [Stappiaceae bacterium]